MLAGYITDGWSSSIIFCNVRPRLGENLSHSRCWSKIWIKCPGNVSYKKVNAICSIDLERIASLWIIGIGNGVRDSIIVMKLAEKQNLDGFDHTIAHTVHCTTEELTLMTSALLAPVTINITLSALLITGRVRVTRFGGGFGLSVIGATTRFSTFKKEEIC